MVAEITQLKRSLDKVDTLSSKEIAKLFLEKRRLVLEKFLDKAGRESRLPTEIVVITSTQCLATEVFCLRISQGFHKRVFYHEQRFWVAEEFDVIKPCPSTCKYEAKFTEQLLEDIIAFCEQHYSNSQNQAPVITYPGLYPVKIVTQFAAGGYEESPKTRIAVVKADSIDGAVKEAVGAGGRYLLELEIFSEGKWHEVTPDGESWFPYVVGLKSELAYALG